MTADGAAMFARFAFPPNLLGYCGPDDSEALFAYGRGDVPADGGAERLARGFEGAWPYLELLAGLAGIDDPLDGRVVEAYWLGNRLLAGVDPDALGWHLLDRFGRRAGRRDAQSIVASVGDGTVPNHAFHVFGVYPWVGLLRAGRGGAEPLRVVDRCRIRWGCVLETDGPTAVVRSTPIVWSGGLSFGPPTVERVSIGLTDELHPGDDVALHWDWVCHHLEPRQRWWLERVTRSELALANRVHALD